VTRLLASDGTALLRDLMQGTWTGARSGSAVSPNDFLHRGFFASLDH
jgi:hypothetical protein